MTLKTGARLSRELLEDILSALKRRMEHPRNGATALSVDEISKAVNSGKSTAWAGVNKLVEQGSAVRIGDHKRGITKYYRYEKPLTPEYVSLHKRHKKAEPYTRSKAIQIQPEVVKEKSFEETPAGLISIAISCLEDIPKNRVHYSILCLNKALSMLKGGHK